jgi:NADPH:quinone reductase-like Zn-dependent oxidoreductase
MGEVLVKVEAAGVGPWDAWIRAGKSSCQLSVRSFAVLATATDFTVGSRVVDRRRTI